MPKCGDSDEPDPVKGFMTGLSEPHGKSIWKINLKITHHV